MTRTLETARLRLRPHTAEDFATYAAFWASERARHIGGPLGAMGAWQWFASDIAQWQLFGHGALAVERKEDTAFIGQVTLNHLPHYPEREMGWTLFDGYEGQGYASEAAAAMRDFALGELGWPTLVSYIDRENTPSIRLAERLGATRDYDARGPGPDDLVYRYPQVEEQS